MYEYQFVKKVSVFAEDIVTVTGILSLLDPTPEEWIKFHFDWKNHSFICEFPDHLIMAAEFLEDHAVKILECY
jgi:hypothetical protein